jgi:tRNA(Ile)-lysidine synthase TilS/MesJ
MELKLWNNNSMNMEWHVMHFHHRQREEADDDCRLVQDLCRQYEIPCHVQDWKDDYSSLPNNNFSQDLARNWRRKTLVEKAQGLLVATHHDGNDTNNNAVGMILTAHHLEDSQESILLKLVRGVHILNVSGISSETKLLDDNNNNAIWLVRPFLKLHKQDTTICGERTLPTLLPNIYEIAFATNWCPCYKI